LVQCNLVSNKRTFDRRHRCLGTLRFVVGLVVAKTHQLTKSHKRWTIGNFIIAQRCVRKIVDRHFEWTNDQRQVFTVKNDFFRLRGRNELEAKAKA